MYLCPTQTGLAVPAAGPALAGGGVLRAGVGLFPRLGYARGLGKLTAGLAGLLVACPPEKALRDLRRSLGSAPLTALVEVVAGPLAWTRTPALDDCNSLKAPALSATAGGWARSATGWALPGTCAAPDAPGRDRHPRAARRDAWVRRGPRRGQCGRRLLHLLRPGMLVLLDRAFDANGFLGEAAATGA